MESLNIQANQIPDKTRQDELLARFKQLIDTQKLAHAYIFDVVDLSIATSFLQEIAIELFGESSKEKIISKNLVDLTWVSLLDGAKSLKVDQIKTLVNFFAEKPIESKYKMLVIESADTMTESAANSLLKFIEEPPENHFIFMVTDKINNVLPTIISRTQVIAFPKPDYQILTKAISNQYGQTNVTKIGSHLVESAQEMDKLMENNWFEQVINAVYQWFGYVLTKQNNAFIVVQEQIMPLATSSYFQQKILELVELIWRDAALISVDNTKNVFDLSQLLEQIQQQQIFQQTEIIFKSIADIFELSKSNVPFQASFEKMTIELMNRKEK